MRHKAKIAATLGPAADDPKTLQRMLRGGLDVARLNFSHGTIDDHRRRVRRLRRLAKAEGLPVALLADLQGPRFRVGRLEGGALRLVRGRDVELLAGEERCEPGKIPVSYAALAEDVSRGDRILMDDGKLELKVLRAQGKTIHCRVVRGGALSDNKGINLPGTRLSTPALTRKDRQDLRHAVALGADWLAVSFVRRAEDVRLARKLLRKEGSDIPVLAKIESPEAVECLESILAEADGLLVARGDLGVELPPERVPLLQKKMIEMANAAGKPVMTATQMLESMRENSRPTRAEASDVANAVLDGTGSLLLTAETAAGKYPAEAIEMMAKIIEAAESSDRTLERPPLPDKLSVALSTCLAGCRTAYEVGARYLVVFTQTGFSARQVARFRPRTPIVALCPDERVMRRLNLVWGVEPMKVPACRNMGQMIRAMDRVLHANKLVKRGDRVVLLAGHPVGVRGTTNAMEVHRVGDPARPKSGAGQK